ncbi:MAG: hypothetical protein OER85_10660 [Gammaproteobacteria bacterium]|nr:hypothetical protein [Gammaproteobacteria bacterium]
MAMGAAWSSLHHSGQLNATHVIVASCLRQVLINASAFDPVMALCAGRLDGGHRNRLDCCLESR